MTPRRPRPLWDVFAEADAAEEAMAKTNAERNAAWRARNGARLGGPPGPEPTQPHGTRAAYRRHERAGEKPCDACATWYREWMREYQRQRRAAKPS